MVFDGQSLNNIPDIGPYPSLLMAGRGLPHATVAVNGTAWSALATTVASRRNLVINQADRVVLVLNGGTSDFATDHDTAAAALAVMESYADSARAAFKGSVLKILAVTIPKSNLIVGTDETNRAAVNPMILASSHWDAVVDLANVTHLTDPNDTTYFVDGTHFTAAGAGVAAAALASALTTLLAAL